MSKPEFVALSEERIKASVDNIADTLQEGEALDDKESWQTVEAELWIVAFEASENTKRWLMEKVCARCGTADGHEARFQHFICPALEVSTGRITRAEYLSRTESQ